MLLSFPRSLSLTGNELQRLCLHYIILLQAEPEKLHSQPESGNELNLNIHHSPLLPCGEGDGSQLLDQAVNSIRGIVEIEQAKSDRSLETTVQVLGIGLGGGAIFSGIITTHIDKINQPLLPKNPFLASLILSIIATIGCTLLAMLGIWIKKRKWKN
ncbi:MAG: hypothetical protein RLZZ184_3427 [Cyanobacteriota bacterium]|jgi:hypothetical protein